MRILTQISRIFVGVLFIISGLIKANDTVGFSYKLKEYFEVFNWPFFEPYAQVMAMFICVLEIISGVALLIGAYNKLNAWFLLLLIVFFTWLTGYSAITHKVTDCGCFGDVIKLKPIESFIKDLVLLFFIIIIFFGVKHIKPLFNGSIEKITLFTALLVSTFFTCYTYMFMPYKDFLPYKIGNNIEELSKIPEGAPLDEFEMLFIYQKEGKNFEFNVNNLPEDLDSYTFVERKDKLIKKGYKAPIHDFKLYTADGIEFTDSIFAYTGYKLVLVQTRIEEGRKGIEPQIAELAKTWQEKQQGNFWALTSSNQTDVEVYRHQHQFNFNYYSMDAIPLKSMVRSNPGLILLKHNVVVKKWGAFNLPTYDIVLKYMK